MILRGATILIVILTFLSCVKEGSFKRYCGNNVIINNDAFLYSPKGDTDIYSYTIDENCLTIRYSHRGCKDANWDVKLIDSDRTYGSVPVTRRLALSITNTGSCIEIQEKETTFDISEIKSSEPTILNIVNSNFDVNLFSCDYKCSMDYEVGPCKAVFRRYYFDKTDGKCKEFIWGGCQGKVPFESYEECTSCNCK